MKYGLFFANAGPFSVPETFETLVRTADEVGIESLWTVEHVLVPVGYGSQYPYSKDGRMPGGEKTPIPDPIVPLAYAAAISQRVRLATGIVILPQRHPAYGAKEFASLDVLSRGRAILGIGIGTFAGKCIFIYGGLLIANTKKNNQHILNWVIGGIFAVTAIIQLWSIWNNKDAVHHIEHPEEMTEKIE